MELVELVRGAQDAMDRGDYRLATTASTHGLSAYPSCLAAHRILGEAHLELGNSAPATKHFEHTLAVDPLNVVARLGLGVASEEQKDYGQAYAHYLHAWEINPALDQVRDELVRLRGLLGVEDRLHPTRAGLAGIHARGGQLHRAANEWRAVLAVEPESRRARTSFAELLWRQGEDGLAAVACRDALRGSPENARALAILADVERRRGGPGADEFAERYRAVDPTGDVLQLLSEWRADVDLSFLATESALVEPFDFTAHAGPVDQLGVPTKISTNALAGNSIAAPDLWDTLVKDLSSELPSTGVAPTLASGVEPFTWNEGGAAQANADDFGALGIQPFNVDDLGGDATPAVRTLAVPPVGPMPTDVSTADIYAAAFSNESPETYQPDRAARISSVSEDDELAALFAPSTDREIADAVPAAPAAGSGDRSPWGQPVDATPVADTAMDGFDDLLALGIEPFTFDGLPDELPDVDDPASYAPRPAARLSTEAAVAPQPAVPTREPMVAAAPAPIVEAPPVPVAPAAPPVFVDPFVGVDGKIDLTAGWDELDKSLAAATPSLDAVGRYDDLAAELDLDGILPFDADIPGVDDDAWAPLTEDDFAVQPAAVRAAPSLGQAAVSALPVDVGASVSLGGEPVDEAVADERKTTHERDVLVAVDVPAGDPWGLASGDDEPSALDALMALPTVDAALAHEPHVNHDVASAQSDDDLLGNDLTAIPVTFDDEVIFGIPSQQASGYTELLRHVDVEEPDDIEAVAAELDPFGNPDSSGDPLAVEDLLFVTSRDGTSPLVEPMAIEVDAEISPFDFSTTDPSAALPSNLATLAASDEVGFDLGDVDPFEFAGLDGSAETETDDAATTAGVPRYEGFTSGIYTGLLDMDAPAEFEANGALEPFSLDDLGAADDFALVVDAPDVLAGVELSPFDFEAALADVESAAPPVVAEEFDAPMPLAGTSSPTDVDDDGPAPEWTGAGGLGMAIGSVVWPAFVNQTSDLIDRDNGNGSVFTRLRSGKAAMIASGQLVVDRRLVVPVAAPVTSPALVEAPAEVADPVEVAAQVEAAAPDAVLVDTFVERRRQRPEMSEQTRLDLMAMRVRLIEDPDSAHEVAATVEKAVSEGLGDPLALRILGEAYLKLGRMEQAAGQFRQAMVARQRVR